LLTVAAVALLVGLCYYLLLCVQGELDYHDSLIALTRMKAFSAIVAVAVAIIWLSSAITAALDARAKDRGDVQESRFVRVLASGAICGFGLVVLVAIAAFWYLAIQIEHPPSEEPIEDVASQNEHLLNGDLLPVFKPQRSQIIVGYLRQGEHCNGCFPDFHRNHLASGTGRIEGLVRINGKGAAGVKVHLFLTDNALSEWGISDAAGKYTISIPPRAYGFEGWGIDAVSLKAALPGKILARTDQDHRYNPVLVVKTDASTTGPIFDFADPIVRMRPIGGGEVTRNDTLEWRLYPGASRYAIYLRSYGTEPSSAKRVLGQRWFHEVETSATTLSLGQFRLQSKCYYSWSLAAYDSSGDRVSRSLDTGKADFRVK
jgi:hypothetical protein